MYTHASDCDATGQDYVATLGNYGLTVGAGVGALEIFTLDPPALATTFSGYYVDVVAVSDAATGHELGIVKGGAGPIDVVDLTTGQGINGSVVPEFSVSGAPDFGSSLTMSDSLQATGKRAIAIANRAGGDGFVGITDFELPSNVAVTLGTSCPAGQACSGAHDPELLHDVTVTPNGVLGIVSGNGVLGVYRLQTGAQEFKVTSHSALPHMRFTTVPYSRAVADSVEATNSRAVVIGKDVQNGPNSDPVPPAADIAKWRVAIVSMRASLSQYDYVSFTDGGPAPSRAHDVAITPNGSKAIVSTRSETLVFDLTVPLASVAPLKYVTEADPLEWPSNTAASAIVSDSVAATDTRAVVIGRWPPGAGARARISVIDLLSPVGTGITIFDFPDPMPPSVRNWLPTDVAINGTGQFAVVRMVDLSSTTNNLRGRLVIVDLASLQISLDQTDAAPLPITTLGMAQGFDQVECSFKQVFTAGEWFIEPGSPSIAHAWAQVLGF